MISEGEIVYWHFYILQYLDFPVWLPNGSNTGCQFSIPQGLIGTCWKVHIFFPKIKAGSYLSPNEWRKHHLEKGRIYPSRKLACPLKRGNFKRKEINQGQIIAKKPRKFCWGPKFQEFLDPRKWVHIPKESFGILLYYWHRTKPNHFKETFWRYFIRKIWFWPNTTTKIST